MAKGPVLQPAAALLLFVMQAASAQNLTLTVSAAPPVRGVVSTASRDDRRLVVASGQTVSLTRSSGIEQRRRAGGGWFWTQIEDVPRNAEHITVTPRLREDGSIEARIEVLRKEGSRENRFSSVLMLQSGEWTELFSSGAGAGAGSATSPRGTKTYGTATTAGDSLYLRVDP